MLRKDTYMELKDFFLRSYDGGPIERHTKKDGLIRIEEVYLSFFGTTVLETFTKTLKEEDLLDGFMQRFLVHIPEKIEKVVPLYIIPEHEIEAMAERYQRLIDELQSEAPKEFVITEMGIKTYNMWFEQNFNKNLKSYYRRYMFAVMKLALVYRLLLWPRERFDNIVDKEHIGWALRVIDLNLDSLYVLMADYMAFDKYDSLVKRVERYMKNHPKCTRRDVVCNVNGLRTVGQLDAILELLIEKGVRKAKELYDAKRR